MSNKNISHVIADTIVRFDKDFAYEDAFELATQIGDAIKIDVDKDADTLCPVEPEVILQKGDFDEKTKKLIDYLLEKEKEGKVCIMTIEGILEANLDDFIKQPTEGLLYDLNRDRVTALTWIDNNSPKWINDFAVCLVITKLKDLLSK